MNFFGPLLAFSLAFLTVSSSSALASGPVIDLGNIEIEGEVRRPPVQSFNASHVFRSGKQKVLAKELEHLEGSVLDIEAQKELQKIRIQELNSLIRIESQALGAHP